MQASDLTTELIDKSPIGLSLVGLDGRFAYANPAFAAIVGYTPDELLTLTHRQLTPERYAAGDAEQLRLLQQQGSYGPYEKEYTHKHGHQVAVRLNGTAVEIGGTPYIWASTERIDDIRSVESALRASEAKFRLLFDTPEDMLLLLSGDGRIVDINHNGYTRLGYSKEEMLGRRIGEFDTPEFAARVPERIGELLRRGQAKFESAHMRKDGTVMPIEINSTIVELDGERFCFSIIRDISEQKQMLERLEKREAMYRAVIETSADGFWVLNTDGRFLEVNDAYLRRSGYSREELLQMNVADIEAREKPEDTAAHMARILQAGHARFESEHRTKDGSVWPVEVVTSLWPIDEPLFFVFIVDISERKRAEARLRKLSLAVERGGEAVVITDRVGTIEYVNPAFSEITGYSADEAVGSKPSMLKSSAQDPDIYREMWRTITSGEIWHGTLIDRRRDGSFYPAMMSIAPILDEAGEISHFVSVQQDMSDYKRLEEQFHQAQKMEALGTLVGGIAHDFNNMLAGIVGNTYLLKKRCADNPVQLASIDVIDKLCSRATAMIKQMLAYAKAEQIEASTFSLNRIVEEALQFTEAAIPESIERSIDITGEPLFVHGDATQIQQAMVNIINNARDAVGDLADGRIGCTLAPYTADDQFLARNPQCRAGRFACLTIGDNGIGIDETVIDKIFDPFFTTKGVDKGNGLGLAMVYGAVKNHQGAIEVNSVPGQGAEFAIYLPLAEQPSRPQPAAAPTESAGDAELIIVADDEEHVRQLYLDVLQELGYRVLAAADGEEAIALYRANHGACALIILDLVMPKMGGMAAARYLRRQQCRTPILFATGYDKDVALKNLDDMRDYQIISKPFDIAHLHATIRQMIAASQAEG